MNLPLHYRSASSQKRLKQRRALIIAGKAKCKIKRAGNSHEEDLLETIDHIGNKIDDKALTDPLSDQTAYIGPNNFCVQVSRYLKRLTTYRPSYLKLAGC